MTAVSEVMHQPKGWRRRQDIIDAAATLLREGGPSAVTHRAVASRAGCSLSATTYYFTGLDDLLAEAGSQNIHSWAGRAQRVAREVAQAPPCETLDEAVGVLLRACLPPSNSLENHYMQLVAATSAPAVNSAYRSGRAQLDSAVQTILDRIGVQSEPQLLIALVDGAAVAALSEGRDIRETARELLRCALRRAPGRFQSW